MGTPCAPWATTTSSSASSSATPGERGGLSECFITVRSWIVGRHFCMLRMFQCFRLMLLSWAHLPGVSLIWPPVLLNFVRWGDKGYFYMPYEYMCHPALASDFWAINWVEGFKNTSSMSESGKLQVPRHPGAVSLPLRTNMKFGWRPDMPDHRDLHVAFDKVDAPSHIKKKTEGDLVGQ